MKFDFSRPWSEATLIAIDTETTGKYPFDARLCEVAAVKYERGEVTDKYQTLINPQITMSDEVIDIHHITNEMARKAPLEKDVIKDFHNFISGGIIVAHHAPFDMGFLALAFEKQSLKLPSFSALCTSLLSQNNVKGVPNHRLSTLVSHFDISHERQHRALDDAIACLGVALNILKSLGNLSLEKVFNKQGGALSWQDYSINNLRANFKNLIKALEELKEVNLTYEGGSRKGKSRRLLPLGLVRNPNGDFLVAQSPDEIRPPYLKRYFLEKISKVEI